MVSAVNFEYRGFDTLGEEYILFVAAVGVSTVLRRLRGERRAARRRGRRPRRPSTAARSAGRLLFPARCWSWAGCWLARPDQPVGGFQGGVVLATAFILIYLAGEFLAFRRSARSP